MRSTLSEPQSKNRPSLIYKEAVDAYLHHPDKSCRAVTEQQVPMVRVTNSNKSY